MTHLTYLEAAVVGLVQAVTELFPVSSLGHNVLQPALIGGSWVRSGPSRHAAGHAAVRSREVAEGAESDRRLAEIGPGQATLIGSVQILALLAGISRDGVTMGIGSIVYLELIDDRSRLGRARGRRVHHVPGRAGRPMRGLGTSGVDYRSTCSTRYSRPVA